MSRRSESDATQIATVQQDDRTERDLTPDSLPYGGSAEERLHYATRGLRLLEKFFAVVDGGNVDDPMLDGDHCSAIEEQLRGIRMALEPLKEAPFTDWNPATPDENLRPRVAVTR
jgi:hypothetical protein